MSYYWFNRKDLPKTKKKKCSKEKAALYYLKNKEATKEQSKN